MIEYLEAAKSKGVSFRCMLWGTVNANVYAIEGVMPPRNRMPFCYIGLTEKCLYLVTLGVFFTSKATWTFTFPFADITMLKVRKGPFGIWYTIKIKGGDDVPLWFSVKGISLGTDIKDQKERMSVFLAEIETLKR